MNELSEELQSMSGLYLYVNKSGSILHYCLAFQPGKGLQTEFDHKIDLICLFGWGSAGPGTARLGPLDHTLSQARGRSSIWRPAQGRSPHWVLGPPMPGASRQPPHRSASESRLMRPLSGRARFSSGSCLHVHPPLSVLQSVASVQPVKPTETRPHRC
jgi:hypothetical protein